ncbi:MAG: NAD-dependent epimerase/dehydratase family protein [Deltaproteobacteria bacterium]|nr:NAD-dependent epimerase/dehydratase family protein [Deltaproteobacteria bacterium]
MINQLDMRQLKIKKKRVVALTGAFGFIGSHLIPLLDGDNRYSKIVAIDIKSPPFAAKKLSYYNLDLTSPSAESELIKILRGEKVDIFVHLAFLSNPVANTEWVHELESVGTFKVLNACAGAMINRFIMWSTTMVYGAYPDNPGYLTESHIKRGCPGFSFVQDKLEAEQTLIEFASKRSEFKYTILRTCTIVGPTVDNIFTSLFLKNYVPVVMGYDPLMQFIHEVDVIDLFKYVLDKDVVGEYNVAADGVLPISEIMRLGGIIPIPIPYSVFKGVISFLWNGQLIRYPAGFLNYMKYVFNVDNERLRKDMGFVPKYSSVEAIKNYLGTRRLRRIELAS